MPKVEYSNTKTDDGWNYTRLTQRFSPLESLRIAARLVRTGVVELELFWKGEQVFMDSVSLRFGESRIEKFNEEDDDAEA